MFPALAGRLLSTAPPGSPHSLLDSFIYSFCKYLHGIDHLPTYGDRFTNRPCRNPAFREPAVSLITVIRGENVKNDMGSVGERVVASCRVGLEQGPERWHQNETAGKGIEEKTQSPKTQNSRNKLGGKAL